MLLSLIAIQLLSVEAHPLTLETRCHRQAGSRLHPTDGSAPAVAGFMVLG